jgi:predicted transcriptional regulator
LNGKLEGVVTTQALNRIPRSEWSAHTVSEVMSPNVEPATISADEDALHALEKMQRTGLNRLLVKEGDQLLGVVSLKDLARFLNLKLELEGPDENGFSSDHRGLGGQDQSRKNGY